MTAKPADENLYGVADDPDWMNALTALYLAKWSVIVEHMKTGAPLIVWKDGKVYRQPPEEAKREFEQAVQNNPRVLAAMRLAK